MPKENNGGGEGQEPEAGKSNLDDTVLAMEVGEPTYQTKPWKSMEQKMFVDSGIADFSAYFVKGFFGMVKSLYTFPSTIRKRINNQTFILRENLNLLKDIRDSTNKERGAMIGAITGGFINAGLMGYTVINASKGNYTPLEILAGANTLFGVFELGRLSKSKQENLEMKARLEDEKLQQTNKEVKEAKEVIDDLYKKAEAEDLKEETEDRNNSTPPTQNFSQSNL